MQLVEGRGVVRIEPARDGIIRIVKPKSNMERVCRCQLRGRVEAKDLVQKNSFGKPADRAQGVSLKVRLVPREAEVLEVRVLGAVRQELTMLHGEQIKVQAGFDVLHVDSQHVVVSEPDDSYPGGGRVSRVTREAGQAVDNLWVGSERKLHYSCFLSSRWLAGKSQADHADHRPKQPSLHGRILLFGLILILPERELVV